ncbi:MAG: 30S ribosomal protein S20 [Candidatus Peregrinibacteria bacterium]|nr:30S ribosomal protein S20 [Candidatus Peregrinibacteria bacterium]
MPIIKSAIKRARQNEVRRARRQPYKTHLKTMMRKVSDLVKEGKSAEATAIVPAVFKAIDTAAKKGIIHGNNADRKKSLVSKLVAVKK